MVSSPDRNHVRLSIDVEAELTSAALHASGHDVAIERPADPDDLRPAIASRAAQPRVVAGEHRPAAVLQLFQKLALGLGDTLLAAEAAEMCVADAGNDSDRRPAERGQCADLAGSAGRQLEHGKVIVRLDRQHAQGHADMVVEILGAGSSSALGVQDGVDHFPRGRFADAAGNADHVAAKSLAIPDRQLIEGLLAVLDLETPAAWPRLNVAAADNGPRCTAVKSILHERGPVAVGAWQGPENVSGFDAAAVGDHLTDQRRFTIARRERGH